MHYFQALPEVFVVSETDDKLIFSLYWFLHLVGGVLYTYCTFVVPINRFSDEGKACAELNTVNGDRIEAVFYLHAGCYLAYVGSMLAITYFSLVKPTLMFKAV